jgi:hypothetical protein
VHIVIAMTVVACVFGITKNGRAVAGFTTKGGMLAYQREFAQIMVKPNRVLPGNLAVTLLTLLTLFVVMGIVLFVTTIAGGIDFLGFGAYGMTCLAYQVLMRTVECEIGVCVMVEFCIPPASNDMAILAFLAV